MTDVVAAARCHAEHRQQKGRHPQWQQPEYTHSYLVSRQRRRRRRVSRRQRWPGWLHWWWQGWRWRLRSGRRWKRGKTRWIRGRRAADADAATIPSWAGFPPPQKAVVFRTFRSKVCEIVATAKPEVSLIHACSLFIVGTDTPVCLGSQVVQVVRTIALVVDIPTTLGYPDHPHVSASTWSLLSEGASTEHDGNSLASA